MNDHAYSDGQITKIVRRRNGHRQVHFNADGPVRVIVGDTETSNRMLPGDYFWWHGRTGYWTPINKSVEDVPVALLSPVH